MASREAQPKPDAGDILVAIHDFQARSSDELSLAKGDKIQLVERDDEFGDGWFLGRHLANENTGLFPEVYTRLAPRNASTSTPNPYLLKPAGASAERRVDSAASDAASSIKTTASAPAHPSYGYHNQNHLSQKQFHAAATTAAAAAAFPLLSKLDLPSHQASLSRLKTTGQDSHAVLSDTLNVIDEHITNLRSPSNGTQHTTVTDSGSDYSAPLDHRMSYIAGDETDEEEEGAHTRAEVLAWTSDHVAEHLFTSGVERQHCEVFRDQEITGEVLLGMDQSSLFLKDLNLGSVGRRLKTWQKIKALQDEVAGGAGGGAPPSASSTRRTTQTYVSDAIGPGSDEARRTRSRTSTVTSGSRIPSGLDVGFRRMSQTTRPDPTGLVSPVSPQQGFPQDGADWVSRHDSQNGRPSAASVRDLNHSRRHSSTDFRLTGTTMTGGMATPKVGGSPGSGATAVSVSVSVSAAAATFFPSGSSPTHRKQPSFDRNWTLGGAYGTRPLSSAGMHDVFEVDVPAAADNLQDSAVELDRGYFSGGEVDGRKRNVLRKRDSAMPTHSPTSSYADEQRMRSATALSRRSRFGSLDLSRESSASPAMQKYFGILSPSRSRAGSKPEPCSDHEPHQQLPGGGASREDLPPVVTRLDGVPSLASASAPAPAPLSASSISKPAGSRTDWPSVMAKPASKMSSSLRALSETVTGGNRMMTGATSTDSLAESAVLQSPTKIGPGSRTPSAGPSFELDSPLTAKSPSTTDTASTAATTAANAAATAAAAAAATTSRGNRKKSKKETSAYTRGLLKISPRDAMKEAEYSGWMRKKSSNLMTTWKPRLFVLKGRRLAYYYSEDDDQEKGLIDISFHRVLPADSDRLTGLHATITGAGASSGLPATSIVPAPGPEVDPVGESASPSVFIFKLVPPRAGLSKAVNFTKPTVHFFAVPNVTQGRLWMAALMKATIERDDSQAITSTYQQKTISLTKARAMRHRPPALMTTAAAASAASAAAARDDGMDNHGRSSIDTEEGQNDDQDVATSIGGAVTAATGDTSSTPSSSLGKKDRNMLGISLSETDSGVSGLERMLSVGVADPSQLSTSLAASSAALARFLSVDEKEVVGTPKTA